MEQRILLYKIKTDELFDLGIVDSEKVRDYIHVISKLLNILHISKQYELFNVSVDYYRPFQLVEVFNLMAPNNVEIVSVTNFKSKEEALNKKCEAEYETSEYPGTNVSSYFVL